MRKIELKLFRIILFELKLRNSLQAASDGTILKQNEFFQAPLKKF
jgi:hypothetical protein